MSQQNYQVTGMSCGHCENAIRQELAELAGIDSIEVSAKTGKLVITASTPIDNETVLAAVKAAGYEAAPQI